MSYLKDNNTTYHSLLSHSFDTGLAKRFGIECAILINHFRHWIEKNHKLKRNYLEGRTWSYQTYAEISADMPYLSYSQVRHSIRKLCKEQVIVKGKFNRRKGDNTIWFAFHNERIFCPNILRDPPSTPIPIPTDDQTPIPEIISPDISQDLSNSTGVCQIRQGSVKNDRALPDTKTDTKTKKKNKPSSSMIKSTPAAVDVCDFLLKKIRERNPEFKQPDLEKWASQMQSMICLDKRDPEKIKQVIEWASNQDDKFWATAFQSPTTVRKMFDRAVSQMNFKSTKQVERDLEKDNRERVECLRKYNFSDPNRYMKVLHNGVEVKNCSDFFLVKFTDKNFTEIIWSKLKSWGLV
jgi:hypothetical protein